MHPVDRGTADVEAFRLAIRILESGFVLLIFPEGTRSPDGNLQRFRPAGIRILAEKGLKLLPIVLLGTYGALSKDARCIRTGQRLHMIILPPIDPAQLGVDELLERGLAQLAEALHLAGWQRGLGHAVVGLAAERGASRRQHGDGMVPVLPACGVAPVGDGTQAQVAPDFG